MPISPNRGTLRPAGSICPTAMPDSLTSIDPCTHAYVRQARRLRASFGDDPSTLHRRLGELAGRASAPDDRSPTPTIVRRVIPTPSAGGATEPRASITEGAFSRMVERELRGGVLRYSQRLALLRLAEKAGIERFRANLLIAMAEHDLRPGQSSTAVAPKPSGLRFFLGALIVEAIAIAIVWMQWG